VSPNAKEETTKNNKSRHAANQILNCYIHKAQAQKQQSLVTAVFPACLPALVSANHRQGGQANLRQNSVNSSNNNKRDGRECEPRFQPQLRFKTATTLGSQPKERTFLTKHQISKSLLLSPSLSHWNYYLYIKYEGKEERKVRLGGGGGGGGGGVGFLALY